jgi:hypothetical protein
MGSSFSVPTSSKFPNQALSHVGPHRRRLQKKRYYQHTGYSRGSLQNHPCDTRFNFLQLQLQVEEPTRSQSPSPSARSIPGLRRFGIGSLRSVTKGQLRVVNASRPPTAISMDQCPMPSEWLPEGDDRNVPSAAHDVHVESTEWTIFSDRRQSYEEALGLTKPGRNSTNSLTVVSCEESEDVGRNKNWQDPTFLEKTPETHHLNVGGFQHASLCSPRRRVLLRLRRILRIFFYQKK